MATRAYHGPGWAALAFSTSAVTFRTVLTLVSIFMSVYTITSLTGVVKTFKYHRLVTYGHSLASSPWQLFQSWNARYGEQNHEKSNALTASPPISDELSDFHIYNMSKSSIANSLTAWSRPQLHVLVDARHHINEPLNLCRTLLSAVVQGYPPPILVGYRPEIDTEKKDNEERTGMAALTESFLRDALDAMQYTKFQQGEEKRGQADTRTKNPDNIVMFLGQDQWVQMPAEVMVRRYLKHREVLSQRLAGQYEVVNSPELAGHKEGNPDRKIGSDKKEEYYLGVLFPASRRKTCLGWDDVCIGRYRSNVTKKHDTDKVRENGRFTLDFEHRDDVLPESSLPRDIYGSFPDPGNQRIEHINHAPRQKHGIPTQYQRPRYLGGGSFIGSAEDVELLLNGALERIGWLKHASAKGHEEPEGGQEFPQSLPMAEKVDPFTYLFSEMFFEQEIDRGLRKYQEKGINLSTSPEREDATKQNGRRPWWSTKGPGKLSLLHWLKTVKRGSNGRLPRATPESGSPRKHQQDDKTVKSNQNYEFSIALDYENRIFQDMADYIDKPSSSLPVNMTNDVRFLSYSRPNVVRSPSQSSAHLFHEPLMLPPELLHPLSPNGKSSPFGLNSAIYNNLEKKILAAARKVKVVLTAEEVSQQTVREDGKKIKRRDQENVEGEAKEEEEEPRIQEIRTITKIPWFSLEFATNVVVPRGSIPSVLDMTLFSAAAAADATAAEEEKEKDAPARKILDSMWRKMWFNQQVQRHPAITHAYQNQKEREKNNGKIKTKEERVTPAKDALLDEYRVPNPFVYALEADAWGGELNNWWNLRGGRGGFWTDQGVWVSWSDICYDLDV